MQTKEKMKIRSVEIEFQDFDYRTPIKFGGRVLDKITLLNVKIIAELINRRERVAEGLGSMPLCTTWGWPSQKLNNEQTLLATKRQAEKIQQIMNKYDEAGHPIEIAYDLSKSWYQAGIEASRELEYPEQMPKLNSLVCSSAFDAALHDAYGKLLKMNVYNCYGKEYLEKDISAFLEDERFKNEYLDKYILTTPKLKLPLYHLIGALDPLTQKEVSEPVGDGLPEYLEEWIVKDGLTHLKVKLNGDDLKWDIERVISIDKVTEPVQAKLNQKDWFYSLDFNERCPNVDYLEEFLARLKEIRPQVMKRIQYIDCLLYTSPSPRDLSTSRMPSSA